MFFNKKTNQDELKRSVAQAALDYIEPNMVVGVGTGSTINFFIEELVKIKSKIDCVVSSSDATTQRLKALRFDVVDVNYPTKIDLYVDGADEANKHKELIKGGGAALTREKICRVASEKFICIIDQTKFVTQLGTFPLPIEVIPSARSYVSKQLIKFGGQPLYREGVTTDQGNIIIDIHNLMIKNPLKLEQEINQITGIVCNGLFAVNPADILLIANQKGKIEIID